MTDLDDLVACGYLTTTPDGTIEHVNEHVVAMTGHARDELLGRQFSDLLSAGGRIFYDTHLAPLLRVEGRATGIALDLVRADATRLPTLVNAAVEPGEAGIERLHFALFDASDRRSYELELLDAKRRAEESERRAVALAHTLQATLIPPKPPEIAGLEIATAYRPAGDGELVGGDFFDVFEPTLDAWWVVAGDVCGKGVEAAVVASQARRAIRELALHHPDPSALLGAVNAELQREAVARFCTVAVTRLTRSDAGWSAEVTTGGHPYPLLVRGGTVRPVGRPGSLVGALPTTKFDSVTVELTAGDVFVLYTDGVTEGRRGDEFYGEERLLEHLTGRRWADAAQVVQSLLDDVVTFQADRPRDDIVLVVLRVPTY